ncbi:MAG: ribonuclease P protein component, partial [Treponema sp.]|nr:ribonuclease P protein component [Treponema sp.]
MQEVFGSGKRYSCYGAKLFVLKNNLPYNRICFTFTKVPKKSNVLWNAVIRNRARRLGREAFRLMKDRLKTSHDLIFLVYPE